MFTIRSASGHERTQKLRQLPDVLVSEGNIEHLIGAADIGYVSAAIADYAAENDLLRIINRDSGFESSPHLRITVRPSIEDSGRDVVTWGWSGDDGGQPGALPELLIRIFRVGEAPVGFKVPLVYIVANAPDVTRGRVVYAHSLRAGSFGTMGDGASLTYVGVTSRGWQRRLREHLAAARAGSPYHFHRALREMAGHFRTHHVYLADLTYRQAMEAEEELVDLYSLHPAGLNMIPGGFAGVRYLAKHGFNADRRAWEDRHVVLERFAAACDRAGRPNPLAAAAWRDDAYAASVICNNPNNFDAETVRTIRRFGEFDLPAEKIADRVACRPDRVRRLLSGSTYERVR